jgi:subtilisin family serine protease
MIRRLTRAVALAGVLLCASPAAAGAQDPAPAAEAEVQRQVLVFLRLPPQHYRPNAGYGASYGDAEGRSARLRIAARIAREHGLRLVSEWPMSSLGVDCFVMVVPAAQEPEEAVARLSSDPQVAWSQPVQLFHGEAAELPNDPLYRAQPAAAAWRLADLHRISTGRRVRVAVIDSMVDASHPDLTGQVETVQNFVLGQRPRPERHGTAVAGVIAARSGNGLGIAGVAPGARILALRACWEIGARRAVCDSLSLARALDYAIARRTPVINMSLTGPPDPLLSRLLDLGLSRGLTIVAAYDDKIAGGGFPASHRGVAAVTETGGGSSVRGVLSAPGRDIPTTQPDGRWNLVSGSSYAAAHVSGLFALLRERSPLGHSPLIAAVAQSDGGIDACATLLQGSRLRRSGPCDCQCAPGREVSAALPK